MIYFNIYTSLTIVFVGRASAERMAGNAEIVLQIEALQTLLTNSCIIIPGQTAIRGSGLTPNDCQQAHKDCDLHIIMLAHYIIKRKTVNARHHNIDL